MPDLPKTVFKATLGKGKNLLIYIPDMERAVNDLHAGDWCEVTIRVLKRKEVVN